MVRWGVKSFPAMPESPPARQGVRHGLASAALGGATPNLSRHGGGASWGKPAGFCWPGAGVFSPMSRYQSPASGAAWGNVARLFCSQAAASQVSRGLTMLPDPGRRVLGQPAHGGGVGERLGKLALLGKPGYREAPGNWACMWRR